MVHQFLQTVNRGGWKCPPRLLEKFGEDAVRHVQDHFEKRIRDFTLRASNLGRPLCQLELEQAGVKGTTDNFVVVGTYGHLVEDLLLFILHAAGVPIVSEQEQVTINLAGQDINGTLDVIIDFGIKCPKCSDYVGKCPYCHSVKDPRVWDIKSASDWAVNNKFNLSFDEFLKQDYFGYTDQLFLYSAAKGVKAGGWIVQNKSNGEILVISISDNQEPLKQAAIRRIETKIAKLISKEKRELIKFDPIVETFKKKPTGNLVAANICSLCEFKFHCWPDMQLKPRAMSKAKNPPLVWYTSYNP